MPWISKLAIEIIYIKEMSFRACYMLQINIGIRIPSLIDHFASVWGLGLGVRFGGLRYFTGCQATSTWQLQLLA